MRWVHVYWRLICAWKWIAVGAGVVLPAFTGVGLCYRAGWSPIGSDGPSPPALARAQGGTPAGAIIPAGAAPVSLVPPSWPSGVPVGHRTRTDTTTLPPLDAPVSIPEPPAAWPLILPLLVLLWVARPWR